VTQNRLIEWSITRIRIFLSESQYLVRAPEIAVRPVCLDGQHATPQVKEKSLTVRSLLSKISFFLCKSSGIASEAGV
jgi:hypothetical protein